jgi:hypothetical protein
MRSPWHLFPVVIVGSGDSLSSDQIALVRKRIADNAIRCIAINNTAWRIPEAHVIYACDSAWWRCRDEETGKKYAQLVQERCNPQIERWSCDNQCKEFGANIIPARSGKPGEGISPADDPRIVRGSGGGTQAVGMAIKWGARHIVLIGFDAKRGKNGKAHYFGDHPVRQLPNPQPFLQWQKEYDDLAAPAEKMGIRIAQCSIDTATTKLIRSTLEEEIGP